MFKVCLCHYVGIILKLLVANSVLSSGKHDGVGFFFFFFFFGVSVNVNIIVKEYIDVRINNF